MTVFGYTRISVDLDEDSRENTSIENQKKIIQDYAASHFPAASLELYEDRDRSGYTFTQREDYQRMRPRLLSGEVSTLIVKDFSRFSRRNSLGLLELEILRDAGVRIISIGDGIDYPTKDEWMLIQFKFLMNEMPVTDTSKKIRQIIASRQKSGRWVCAVPYGYRLINTKEMTYEIDPPAAEVVREVFALYNSGWGYQAIANRLTERGVPTPRAHEIASREASGRAGGRRAGDAWSVGSLQKMLQNDFYIGTLRQHKYTRAKINGADRRLEEGEQIVIENAHAPILDTQTFLYAQDQWKLRTRSHYRGVKKYPCDYSGYLFCGDCGAPMFSRSRPDLRPSYVCGRYMKQGRKGCAAHHIRVDRLDEVLRRYIVRLRESSAGMLSLLEEAVRCQPEREEAIGRTVDSLDQQLEQAKHQLKTLYKRRLLDTMDKDEAQAATVEETYRELETELLNRIRGLETQLRDSIDSRNRLIEANRRAKTVMDVFEAILRKPKLDKRDVSLLIERIDVYEDRLDIRLKADIDALLAAPPGPETVTQAGARHAPPLTVNIVSEGDPLEIYTSRDGEVIFKKYSMLGGLEDFSAQLCETMSRSTGRICAITDRDAVLSVAGGGKRELQGKHISAALERIMENRRIWQFSGTEREVPVCDEVEGLTVSVAAPILSEGDLLGLVLFIASAPGEKPCEADYKLAQTIAAFLGRHMEG